MEDSMADYSAVLADLRARRAKIDTAIEAIEDLIGVSDATQTVPAAMVVGKGQDFAHMTVYEAALAVLNRAKRPMGTSDIAKTIERGGYPTESTNFYNTVYGTLMRELKRKEIEHVGSKWKLASRPIEHEQRPELFPASGQRSA